MATVKPWVIASGVGVGLVLLLAIRNASQATVGGVGQQIGGAAVDAVAGVAGGVVLGIGDAVGLPRTDAEKGRALFEQGQWFEASKYMPAGDFIGALWGKFGGSGK